MEESAPDAKTYDGGAPVPDHGCGVLWCGEGCPDMENGSAVVKPLVTRTSDGVEDDTFVKRLEEGAPVAEEGVSGTEESASGTEEGACGTKESALLCSRESWCRALSVE